MYVEMIIQMTIHCIVTFKSYNLTIHCIATFKPYILNEK